MNRTRTLLTVLLLSFVAALPAQEEDDELRPLSSSGEPFVGTLLLMPSSPQSASHRISIPDDCVALHVELACGRADLDLRAVLEGSEREGEPLEWRAETDFGREELRVHRFSDPPLAPGSYRIEVRYPWPDAPAWEGRRLTSVEYRLTASVVRAREDGELRPGEPWSAQLDDESGRFRSFRIEVPDSAPALRIDVASAGGDIDLYLQRQRPILRAAEAEHFAAHGYGLESLLVTGESLPPLRPGTWFLDVVDPFDEGGAPAPFTVLVQFDARLPSSLLALPPFPEVDDADPLERALAAVVEIFVPEGAGSGCLIDAEGRLLTCAHVVSDLALDPLQEIVVGVTLDPRQPSVERFRARVVAFDRERDLAVARITSGFYGQPLPADFRFPALELGDPDALRIGDPLWIVGYPGTGGSQSRVSITATRGILAGFETNGRTTLLKTDAKMHEGHSGGAVLDEHGKLVALPSFITYSGASELGYLIPVDAMPDGW